MCYPSMTYKHDTKNKEVKTKLNSGNSKGIPKYKY